MSSSENYCRLIIASAFAIVFKKKRVRSSVVERRPFKASVAGSNPAGPSMKMPYPTILKEKSKALRRKGFSLNEISKRLDVSKTTIHDWVSHSIELNEKARARINRLIIKGRKTGNFNKYRGESRGRYMKVIVKPKGWSKRLIKLIAHLAFDGGKRPGGYDYYNSKNTLINQVADLANELFGLKAHIREGDHGVMRAVFFSADFSRYVQRKIIELFKYIPHARIEEKRAFLQAFFDDEGNAFLDKKYRNSRVRGYQDDKKVLLIVEKLLLFFEVNSKIDRNELVISKKADIAQFKKEINFSPNLFLNPNRKNSIWKRKITKREILGMILAKNNSS